MVCEDISVKAGQGGAGRFVGIARGVRGLVCLDWRGWARTIVAIRATPRQVALGVALGAFIAFTPFIGLQMLLAGLVAAIVGASKKAAMLAVWISNPLTMGPIFAVTYQVGVVLGSPQAASASVPGQGGAGTDSPAGFLAEGEMGLGSFIQAGWGYVLPMLVGGVVLGLLAALVAYSLTHRGVVAYQLACEKRRQASVATVGSV